MRIGFRTEQCPDVRLSMPTRLETKGCDHVAADSARDLPNRLPLIAVDESLTLMLLGHIERHQACVAA
jgi:hypothetical protein